jgi:hypothetical protein
MSSGPAGTGSWVRRVLSVNDHGIMELHLLSTHA